MTDEEIIKTLKEAYDKVPKGEVGMTEDMQRRIFRFNGLMMNHAPDIFRMLDGVVNDAAASPSATDTEK